MIIDVSQYQGAIEWDKVAKDLDFAVLRASVGLKADTRYNINALALEKANKPYHAYHYLKANSLQEADSEAKAFANATAGTKPLFYVIDAESASVENKNARMVADRFETKLREYVGKDIKVAVYIAHHKYLTWKLDYSHYAYVWIPRYGKNTGMPDAKPVYPCDVWQYTSKGKVEGVKGNVDISELTGTKPMSYFTGKDSKQKKANWPTLRFGSRGSYVQELQRMLIDLGYELGKIGADGKFGLRTYLAVKKYQKANGLKADGIVGEKTRESLLKDSRW